MTKLIFSALALVGSIQAHAAGCNPSEASITGIEVSVRSLDEADALKAKFMSLIDADPEYDMYDSSQTLTDKAINVRIMIRSRQRQSAELNDVFGRQIGTLKIEGKVIPAADPC
jgi:hypothetical protein